MLVEGAIWTVKRSTYNRIRESSLDGVVAHGQPESKLREHHGV